MGGFHLRHREKITPTGGTTRSQGMGRWSRPLRRFLGERMAPEILHPNGTRFPWIDPFSTERNLHNMAAVTAEIEARGRGNDIYHLSWNEILSCLGRISAQDCRR